MLKERERDNKVSRSKHMMMISGFLKKKRVEATTFCNRQCFLATAERNRLLSNLGDMQATGLATQNPEISHKRSAPYFNFLVAMEIIYKQWIPS